MRSARRVLVLALWGAMFLGGCSSTLRFDDHSIDAGVPTADAAVDGPPSCITESCGFAGAPCGDRSCSLECPHLQSCSGRCGSACSADCEENSSCILIAEDGAELRCEQGARCSFRVGPSSRIECERESDCGTRCLSSCTVACAAGAVCTLACGSAAPLAPVSGSASCPVTPP